MLLRHVMSHPVVTVLGSSPATDAAGLLVRRGFTALPVVDEDGLLIGIVTEADLLTVRPATAAPGRHRTHRHPVRTTVEQLMTTPVESLTPGCTVTDAARMMIDERIRCVPVVDGRRIVGVVSRRDLLRANLLPADR